MADLCSKEYVIVPDSNLSTGPRGPQGPQGPPGDFASLPLSTDNVVYRGNVLTGVLDTLLYIPLVINSFVANQLIYEKGQVLTAIQLTWSYNKAIQSQSITGTGVVPPSLTLGQTTANVTLSSISINTLITLTADDISGDGHGAITSNLNVIFYNKIYYGKSGIPGSVNSAFLIGLTGQSLQAGRNVTFNVTTGVSEYIWYACPVAMGLPSFTANGFSGGFNLTATISHTNASGETENYYVFSNANDNLGITNVVVS